MAWQANNDISIGFNTMGAKALQASTTITTSTQTTGVFVGRGLFNVEIAVTALSVGVGPGGRKLSREHPGSATVRSSPDR